MPYLDRALTQKLLPSATLRHIHCSRFCAKPSRDEIPVRLRCLLGSARIERWRAAFAWQTPVRRVGAGAAPCRRGGAGGAFRKQRGHRVGSRQHHRF